MEMARAEGMKPGSRACLKLARAGGRNEPLRKVNVQEIAAKWLGGLEEKIFSKFIESCD
jgi:hypothetical protein